MEIKEYLIEHKREIMSYLIVILLSVSLLTIGWVIYRFFFWKPPIDPSSFIVNLSNLTG